MSRFRSAAATNGYSSFGLGPTYNSLLQNGYSSAAAAAAASGYHHPGSSTAAAYNYGCLNYAANSAFTSGDAAATAAAASFGLSSVLGSTVSTSTAR